MVFAMVVLGGAVRLSGSGLSMVDWNPILGVLPPFTDQAWEQVFARYREFPEYQLVNQGMTLEGFRFIFYMEYFHRLLGRLVGLVFAVPFIYWLARGVLAPWLRSRLWIALFLGGAQGLLGWYMVKSGLVDNPHVSQYRLTAHLLLAVFIYLWLLDLVFRLLWNEKPVPLFRVLVQRLKQAGTALATLIFIMIGTGGFMAGTRAGFIYNTWPRMGDSWMPGQVWAMTPLWRNLTENPMGVQFVHRWLAVLVLLAVFWYAIRVIRRVPLHETRVLGWLLVVVVLVQVFLGIATLVLGVPRALGVAHQGGALVLLGLVIGLRGRLRHGDGV
jgi:cytochrome c oxidase assembly protein subunit 15